MSWGRRRREAYEVDEVAGVGCYVGRVVEVLDRELERQTRLFMVLVLELAAHGVCRSGLPGKTYRRQ